MKQFSEGIQVLFFLFLCSFFSLSIFAKDEYSYPGGSFKWIVHNKWIDYKSTGEEIEYHESSRDLEWITLFNSEFHKTINIPVKGGQAFIAIDDKKKKWKPLFIMKNLSKSEDSDSGQRIPKKKALEVK